MPMIESALDLRSPEARANAETMRGLVADLRETAERVRQGGGQAARERHLARGKLLPRDRIRALIDPDSPFLEVGHLAAHGLYGGEVPSAGIISGIGRVAGRECMIVANDATVKGRQGRAAIRSAPLDSRRNSPSATAGLHNICIDSSGSNAGHTE